MKKLLFLVALLWIATAQISFAQTYEEYVKQQNKQLNDFKQQRDEGLKALQKQFDDFVKERNKEYAAFLKQNWESYEAFKGNIKPAQPKLPIIPAYTPEKPKIDPVKPKIDTIQKPKKPEIVPAEKERAKEIKPVAVIKAKGLSTADAPMPLIPRSLTIPMDIQASNNTQIDFYGLKLGFEVDAAFRQIKLTSPSETGVSNWFTKACATDYQIITSQLLDYKSKYGINDWGTFLLAKSIGEKLYMGDNDNSRLFSWFVMLQSGYDIKPGLQNESIIVLLAITNEVYEMPFTYFNSKKYYIHQGIPGGKLKAFNGSFPDAEKALDLNFYKTPKFASKPGVKILKFNYNGKPYEFKFGYDNGMVSFLNDAPLAEIQVYFDASVSGFLKESAEASLAPILSNFEEAEKVNFLLSFVQNAFVYQTDDQQFKKEKFMLPDQVIHYPACDCEDRAVLFAYLVRSLVGLDVIGLEYPGHIATAVRFNKDQHGDFLMYKNKKFIVADPTYINAPFGLTMPDYAATLPKMIAISNRNVLNNNAIEFWLQMNQYGAFRGNNLNDFLVDDKGNYYLTGYFTDGFKSGQVALTGKPGKRTALIAKFSPDKKLIWASAGQTGENTTGMAIQLDKQGFPVIAGSFTGELVIEGKKITAIDNKNDVFIARFNPNGKIQWLSKAGLDTVNQQLFLSYLTQFNQNGEHIRTGVFNETNSSLNGLYLNEKEEYVFGGSFQNTTGLGLTTKSFAAGNNLNIAELLQVENKRLISNNYESAIAGLFAAIKLIKSDGIVFPGSEAQKALDIANPKFKTSSPNVYANIGKISMVKNAGNIIEIRTANGVPVMFDKLKVEDKSQVKITTLSNENEQIDVISRVKVGKMVVWYDLNYIRLDKKTGNLIFDYDSDHTQATLNLKKDILD
jgi:hypothetical protein